jgi:hypothetical protein
MISDWRWYIHQGCVNSRCSWCGAAVVVLSAVAVLSVVVGAMVAALVLTCAAEPGDTTVLAVTGLAAVVVAA